MKKQPIILVGGGGHCISCIDVVEQTNQYEIVGILDLPNKIGSKVLDYPIIGSDSDIQSIKKDCPNFLITLGQIKSSHLRQTVFNQIKCAGGRLPLIISPTAYISKHANIGEGTIIMHQAFINAAATIGNACIINSKSLIEHEAFIGNFCHISTATCINGQVNIGSNCFIGSNTVVGNNITISDNSIIAAGSQVLKNLATPGIYIGNPLRKIR